MNAIPGNSLKPFLIDPHGRRISKLRLSILDACNLRCLYCMPENPTFMPKSDWATSDELIEITKNLVSLGIEEVRVSGGEPLIRPDFRQIMIGLSKLPLKKWGLTTNAVYLKRELGFLKEVGLKSINISIDSLDQENFAKITRSKHFENVIESTLLANEIGMKVKINTVLMNGLNNHEVENFVEFSARYGIEVRFLEVMKVGVMASNFEKHFIPAQKIIDQLNEKYSLRPVSVSKDSTSFIYELNNGAKIGFIASESQPFCGHCSRLRLGPKGQLRPCLFADTGPSLRNIPFEKYPEILKGVMALKPQGRLPLTTEGMYQIGG